MNHRRGAAMSDERKLRSLASVHQFRIGRPYRQRTVVCRIGADEAS